ncbi:MAG: hypothetical protein NTY53_08245 [Kiritimatiellaeota bacterium]|nr:hypothetical protein [Kiritimatiellota bacterium]
MNTRHQLVLWLCVPAIAGAVEFTSPGFPPSQMDADGKLVEDWGALGVRFTGAGVTDAVPFRVEAVKLDQLVPAARAVAQRGSLALTLIAYRAPVWPSGVDVLRVRVEETHGKPITVTLGLDLPVKAHIGQRTVMHGGRTVVACPAPQASDMPARAWGSCDDFTPLPGWGKPVGECDPAFRNIRAGMGGVPIRYQFSVPKGGAANVVLGFCESHSMEPNVRPLFCQVEGAPAQTVDPIAKWGRHKPGVLQFEARDANRDGKLDIVIRAAAGASDHNPILNVIWLFPATATVKLADVLAGKLNTVATHYVDVGGENDQTLFPTDKLEYPLHLPAKGVRELTFLVACAGGSAPPPTTSAWTLETLYRAAYSVWKDQ